MKRLGKLDVVTQSLSHMGDWEDHEIKGSLGYVVRHSFKTERINKRFIMVKYKQRTSHTFYFGQDLFM